MPIISTFPTGSGGSGGGGGIPLAPVTGVATLAASGKAYLKWTDSIDTVVGDATLAAWAGTLLVRKAGSVPANRRDGTVVVDNKTRDKYKSQYFCCHRSAGRHFSPSTAQTPSSIFSRAGSISAASTRGRRDSHTARLPAF